MSGDVKIKVEGLKEIEKALVELVDVGGPRIMTKGLKRGMERVRDAAKAAAPVFPIEGGALRDAIELTTVKGPTAKRASSVDALAEVGLQIAKKYKTGPIRGFINPRTHWHFIEWGAPGRGIAARPFLRPALEANQGAAVTEFKVLTKAEIDRVVARLARKSRRKGR